MVTQTETKAGAGFKAGALNATFVFILSIGLAVALTENHTSMIFFNRIAGLDQGTASLAAIFSVIGSCLITELCSVVTQKIKLLYESYTNLSTLNRYLEKTRQTQLTSWFVLLNIARLSTDKGWFSLLIKKHKRRVELYNYLLELTHNLGVNLNEDLGLNQVLNNKIKPMVGLTFIFFFLVGTGPTIAAQYPNQFLGDFSLVEVQFFKILKVHPEILSIFISAFLLGIVKILDQKFNGPMDFGSLFEEAVDSFRRSDKANLELKIQALIKEYVKNPKEFFTYYNLLHVDLQIEFFGACLEIESNQHTFSVFMRDFILYVFKNKLNIFFRNYNTLFLLQGIFSAATKDSAWNKELLILIEQAKGIDPITCRRALETDISLEPEQKVKIKNLLLKSGVFFLLVSFVFFSTTESAFAQITFMDDGFLRFQPSLLSPRWQGLACWLIYNQRSFVSFDEKVSIYCPTLDGASKKEVLFIDAALLTPKEQQNMVRRSVLANELLNPASPIWETLKQIYKKDKSDRDRHLIFTALVLMTSPFGEYLSFQGIVFPYDKADLIKECMSALIVFEKHTSVLNAIAGFPKLEPNELLFEQPSGFQWCHAVPNNVSQIIGGKETHEEAPTIYLNKRYNQALDLRVYVPIRFWLNSDVQVLKKGSVITLPVLRLNSHSTWIDKVVGKFRPASEDLLKVEQSALFKLLIPALYLEFLKNYMSLSNLQPEGKYPSTAFGQTMDNIYGSIAPLQHDLSKPMLLNVEKIFLHKNLTKNTFFFYLIILESFVKKT
jgi:hypothetical protein